MKDQEKRLLLSFNRGHMAGTGAQNPEVGGAIALNRKIFKKALAMHSKTSYNILENRSWRT